jgi:hypothetical protein
MPTPDLNQQGIVTAVSIIFPADLPAMMLQCQVTPSRCRYGCLRDIMADCANSLTG